ncbi:MAG: hypothetical protein HC770_00960 [Pseudanabaena sp. CRU_2_10]|nr:hypothetical protein [Pseudanabaena sp. CRU_2_10]
MRTRSYLLASALAITAITGMAAPSHADPLLTDQDYYSRDFSPTYNESITKVLDLTSSTNVVPPWLQFEFMDQKLEREFTSFRTMNKEMWELQNSDDDNIRTRDLANPYTTSLASFCTYYRSSGIELPAGTDNSCLEAQAPPAPEPPRYEPAPPPVRRPAPVPALW